MYLDTRQNDQRKRWSVLAGTAERKYRMGVGYRAAARTIFSASNVVGSLLSDDPQRREGTAERPGASSDADDLSFEGGCGFDEGCTLSHESP
jgi:hypothetical protein